MITPRSHLTKVTHMSQAVGEFVFSTDEFQTSELLERLRTSHEVSLHIKNKSRDASRDLLFMFSDHSWEECPRCHMTSMVDNATNHAD